MVLQVNFVNFYFITKLEKDSYALISISLHPHLRIIFVIQARYTYKYFFLFIFILLTAGIYFGTEISTENINSKDFHLLEMAKLLNEIFEHNIIIMQLQWSVNFNIISFIVKKWGRNENEAIRTVKFRHFYRKLKLFDESYKGAKEKKKNKIIIFKIIHIHFFIFFFRWLERGRI